MVRTAHDRVLLKRRTVTFYSFKSSPHSAHVSRRKTLCSTGCRLDQCAQPEQLTQTVDVTGSRTLDVGVTIMHSVRVDGGGSMSFAVDEFLGDRRRVGEGGVTISRSDGGASVE